MGESIVNNELMQSIRNKRNVTKKKSVKWKLMKSISEKWANGKNEKDESLINIPLCFMC